MGKIGHAILPAPGVAGHAMGYAGSQIGAEANRAFRSIRRMDRPQRPARGLHGHPVDRAPNLVGDRRQGTQIGDDGTRIVFGHETE